MLLQGREDAPRRYQGFLCLAQRKERRRLLNFFLPEFPQIFPLPCLRTRHYETVSQNPTL
jgi:hypothetical protein